MADTRAALLLFDKALEYTRCSDLHRKQLEWQRNVSLNAFTETDLLREAAWVVLCSGFRESVVRSIFGHISLCFCDWESADAIVRASPICKIAALASFKNRAKLDAIVRIAGNVQSAGFSNFRVAVLDDPIKTLQGLPFIGPTTSWHLAKNLGLDVAKPDRHLVRVASRLGFASAHDVCLAISKSMDEPLKVVDLVLWRYLADHNRAPARRDGSSNLSTPTSLRSLKP
jgi:endonuclease III